MNQTQNGVVAGNDHPVKKTFKQGRHFTPNQLRNAQFHHHGGILAPSANHTKDNAVATLAEKRVFSRPEFMGLGLGVVEPQGHQHGVIHVITPSPIRLSNQQANGCKSHNGANQMATSQSTTTGASPTTTPDYTSLSFVKVEYKGPRKQRLTNWFSVPDEDYCSGNATGYRVAAEFMAWLQTSPATYGTGMIVREIMGAAFAVLAQPHTQDKQDKRGAAVTFLDAMTAFLMFAAQRTNHQAYLEGKAQHSEDWAKKSAELEAERNRETGRRLAAARKAKREARMAGSGRAE
jgi:hypothetical protein